MNNIVVECQMLIRRPAAAVFNAMIDPAITTNFWFTKSTGKLREGETVTWQWEMYGASADVAVKKIVENKLISFDWGEPKESVDFSFTSSADGNSTYVVIKNYGFAQTGDALISKIIDTTGGFTTVLDGMKAWLEHELSPNLISDKFPKEFINH
ncbi:MAG: polyketide cyclase [Sphingobacteriales bacterium 41-5]|nr:MAG: polyketide cyclase [Sphingobacteriales bacterium 41-5]